MQRKLLFVFWISLLALFLESSLIRWLPSQVRALAYFKNLVLISSFLGFGLGAILKERGRWLVAAFPLFLILELAVALALGQFRITGRENAGEHLWLLYFDLPRTAPPFPLSLAIPIFYVLNALTFIPFGQLLASAMRDVGDSILAYVANVLGGVAGTLLFILLSFGELGPRFWFIPAMLAYASLFLRKPRVLGVALLALLVVALLPLEKPGTIWSPYYALRVDPISAEEESAAAGDTNPDAKQSAGFNLSVNGSFHQAAFNFDQAFLSQNPGFTDFYESYLAPYRYYESVRGEMPRDVLVVGAGSGNDVSVALSQGASRVDAVEIDPRILRIGEELHPQQIYADPRVRRHVDDARSYLQNTGRRYDLVVFGTLDSQIALSALSTIRLDNYVYTVQSMEQARQALKPDGMLALYFWAEHDWIRSRLIAMVAQAFGQAPEVILPESPALFNMVVVATAGPAGGAVTDAQDQAEPSTLAGPEAVVPTDDWPYLYQRERALSPFYLGEILVLVLLSFAAVRLALRPGLADAPAGAGRFDLPLFLQGMAFLLLETRSITAMSLLFGATWVVSAVVIAAVLFVVMLANLAVRVWDSPVCAPLRRTHHHPVDRLFLPDGGAARAQSRRPPRRGRARLRLAHLLLEHHLRRLVQAKPRHPLGLWLESLRVGGRRLRRVRGLDHRPARAQPDRPGDFHPYPTVGTEGWGVGDGVEVTACDRRGGA
ncbi:MAG TPA: hypothetical protein VER55_06595 [Ardenticatenaceae bacterium]|nr:hypothetical protein [Ardenticatenaceae bacterium]